MLEFAAEDPVVIGVLILVILLILHASLYPWRFAAPAAEASPFWLLTHSWPGGLSRRVVFDAVANVVLYVPLGISAYLALVRKWRRWAAAAAAVGLGTALSAGIEMLQLYAVTRRCNTADWASNACGTAAGVALGILLERFLHGGFRKWSVPRAAAGAILLLCCWVGFQIYPVMPETFRFPVYRKLRQLFSSDSFALVPMLVSAAEWTVVATLVRAAAGARQASAIFAPLLLLAPMKLLIVSRTVTWPELAALPLALLLARVLPEPAPRRALLAAALLAAALVLNGLTPFHLSAGLGTFRWIPFQTLIAGEREFTTPILILKIFRYGALIWLLREAGSSFRLAGGFVVALLAAMEAVQLYLPGHVAEATDPLLAAALAGILLVFERHRPRLPVTMGRRR